MVTFKRLQHTRVFIRLLSVCVQRSARDFMFMLYIVYDHRRRNMDLWRAKYKRPCTIITTGRNMEHSVHTKQSAVLEAMHNLLHYIHSHVVSVWR